MASRELTPEQKAVWAYDYAQIQNVMSRHMYYHMVGKHDDELDRIWAKKHKISWTTPKGIFEGEDWKHAYDTMHKKSDQANLERVIKLHPEVENKKENLAIGTLIIHTLTTPLIEIAEDGQTAKGIWYSPGIMSEINYDGTPSANYMWEKYGVDFVKEDGEWKIWHIRTYYDAVYPPNKSWTDPPSDPPPPSMPHNDILPEPKIPLPEEDVYEPYSPLTVPKLMPEMPEPYKTFSDVKPYR